MRGETTENKISLDEGKVEMEQCEGKAAVSGSIEADWNEDAGERKNEIVFLSQSTACLVTGRRLEQQGLSGRSAFIVGRYGAR